MKRIFTLLLALVLALSLFSCKNNATEEDQTAQNASGLPVYSEDLDAYLTLPDYMNITLKQSEVTPTESDLTARKTADFAGKDVSRAAQNGDTVNIDYCGKRDGVAFEGGTASGQSLELGSGSFIDGFEEGLVGVLPGQTVDLNLSFPDPYPNNPDLAGAPAVFTVTLNYIETGSQEIPELTDELVRTLTDYKTVAAYEAGIYAEISETLLENTVWNLLFEQSTFHSLPEDATKYYKDSFIQNYKNYAAAYSMEFSDFLTQMGTDETEFLQSADEYAQSQVKSDLIQEAIRREQNLTVSSEAREQALNMIFEEYSAQYGLSDVDAMVEMLGKETAEKLVVHQVLLDYLCARVALSAD